MSPIVSDPPILSPLVTAADVYRLSWILPLIDIVWVSGLVLKVRVGCCLIYTHWLRKFLLIAYCMILWCKLMTSVRDDSYSWHIFKNPSCSCMTSTLLLRFLVFQIAWRHSTLVNTILVVLYNVNDILSGADLWTS